MANSVVPARGMRDILPADKTRRDRVLQIIKDTYRDSGFEEIETPAIEPLSRLLSNQGGDNEKMIFEILKRGLAPDEPVEPKGATDLGLRYDLTVPLTRFYASNINQLPRVFRSLQTGPVWRAERPQKGRYRQFTQCDIDILGDETCSAEIDLLATTLKAFDRLGMSDQITLLINDRRILTDVLEKNAVGEEKQQAALIILDKLDKIGADAVIQELQAHEVCADPRQLLEDMKVLQKVDLLDSDTQAADTDFYDLPQIVTALKQLRPWANVQFTPTMVRGMGYYTGPIFEVSHNQTNYSVAGGGRYDKVVGKWLGKDVPACGFSIGFERIIDLANLPQSAADKVAVGYKPGVRVVEVLQLREELIDAGYIASLVQPPRRIAAAFFDQLQEQGYSYWLDGRQEDAAISSLRRLEK